MTEINGAKTQDYPMKNFSCILLCILFLSSCKRDGENKQLKIVSSVKIHETEETLITSLTHAEFVSDEALLLLCSNTDLLSLNIRSGKLSPFIRIDSNQVENIFSFVKSQYPDLVFLDDTLKKNDYTLKIGNFQLVENYVYVSIISQFSILGKLDNTEASILSYFNSIQKYDLKTKKLIAQYIMPDSIKTNYSKSATNDENYLSPSQGFYVDAINSKIYSKINASPIKERSSFLLQFDFDSKLTNKAFLPIYHNRNKQKRKDYSFGFCSFYKFNNHLYCSDGKDIFTIYPNKALCREIIADKNYHVKSFKMVDNNEIIYNKGCDTSIYSSVNIIKDGTHHELIPNLNIKRLFLFQKGIHSITFRGENYYFEIYEKN